MPVIKVEGKEHRQGMSKRGNEYDFIVLHFLADRQRGVEGRAAVQKLMNPDILPYQDILVGQHYDLETDLNGEIVGMTPAKV